MATFFALLAATLNIVGYIIYIRDLRRGGIKPNLASWLVWMGITILSVSSYTKGTGDLVKSIFSWSILIVNTIAFFFIVRRSKFSSLSRLDMGALFIGLAAAVAWAMTDSPWWANMFVQAAIIIGGVPTVLSVWRQPANEKPISWLFWGGAYLSQMTVILTRWTGHLVELVYPVISLILYGGIGFLALRRPAIVPLPLELNNETPRHAGAVSVEFRD